VIPDSPILGAWANETDATEAGAYGCVIATVELLRDLFAVRRAETGTGADYYVGPRGAAQDDLENCFRLEVSGVSDGTSLKSPLDCLLRFVRSTKVMGVCLPLLVSLGSLRKQ
jgi:hypothetical protein